MARTVRIQATITSLAPGGDAVAHAELAGQRRAVFIPHCAPGDVLLAVVDPATRPARGRLLRLLEPGPDRVTPACPWSTRCGGCDWMHLSLEGQSGAHVDHVREALPAAWRQVPVLTHAAPSALAYRTRARVHVRCDHGHTSIGMHEARTHQPVDVGLCAVLAPPIERARSSLAPLFEGSSGRGQVQIGLGVRRVPVLDLRWTGELAPTCFARLERAVIAGDLAGARVTLGSASRPAIIGDPTPWMIAADGAPLRLAPGGFAQASEQTSAVLARYVADLVHTLCAGGARAVELYAGAGNFSVLLAREMADLVLVEADRDECDAARHNLAARGLSARVVQSDAANYRWKEATKLVLLDPPRAGAAAVAEKLVASHVRHVVYVSCDTPTLGRDLRLLSTAYDVRSVATFEMFPQTSHIETVVALERRRRAGATP